MRPTDRPLTAFGDRLDRWAQEQRESDPLRRKVTQTNMAEMFGVSTSAVSNWRLGVDVPSMNNLSVIAKKTGIPFAELAELVELAIAARTQSDFAPAARKTGRTGKAQQAREKQDEVGEESQAPDEDDWSGA